MKKLRLILAFPFLTLSAIFSGIYEDISGDHDCITFNPKITFHSK